MKHLGRARLTLALALGTMSVACDAGVDLDSAPTLATQAAPIRNGTREPQLVQLTEGQKLALGWLHPRGAPDENFCTGTLITPRVVATAEHCVSRQLAEGLSFGVGLLPSDPRATFPVEFIYIHPTLDAAVLVLAEDATIQIPELVPIPHNRDGLTDSLLGQEVEAAGFGETYDRTRTGRYFAVVELVSVDDTSITVDGRGQQGICFGDSGGPVLMSSKTGGIKTLAVESFGDSSCLDRDTMTRLDVIDGWLQEIINGAPPETNCGDIDLLGICREDVAVWCDNGLLRELDCARNGDTCGWIDDETGHHCVDDPRCAAAGAAGICSDGQAIRCMGGHLTIDDCAAQDEHCREGNGGVYCHRAPAPDAAVSAPDTGTPDMGAADAGERPDADERVDTGEAVPPIGGSDSCAAAPGAPTNATWLMALALLPALTLRRRQRR